MTNKTKIITTISSNSWTPELIDQLQKSGATALRFNFSHATPDEVRGAVEYAQKLSESGAILSTILDTKGIEIRTGKLAEKKSFTKGESFLLVTDMSDFDATKHMLFIDYPYLGEDTEIGGRIEIDSGNFHVRVLEKHGKHVLVEAENDAIIGSGRHVNLPGVKLRLPSLTEKDKTDLAFAVEMQMTFIASSFVRNAANIRDMRAYLDSLGGHDIRIISKIENQEAIENLDEIIEISDGVMVARGDLGIEVPMQMLPLYQKEIIEKCQSKGKFVIVATHMLKSMTDSPSPTRAEVSDVFAAVMAQTDTTMLSEETAIGDYKQEAVEAMYTIATEAEKHAHGFVHFETTYTAHDEEKKHLIQSALHIAKDMNIKNVLVFTKSGRLARLAAAYRPLESVHAFTPSLRTCEYINLLYGITPHFLKDWKTHEENAMEALRFLRENHLLDGEKKVIIVTDRILDGREVPTLEIMDI